MRPIRSIAELRVGAVLYHSAFGFAHIQTVRPDMVVLGWDVVADNLPERVSHEVLQRVYAQCEHEGFFHRSVHERAALTEDLQTKPVAMLKSLLRELHGAQREVDIREWITNRGLMTRAAFRHWWSAVWPSLAEEPGLVVQGDAVLFTEASSDDPLTGRLANPLLPPGRRLDLALSHRSELGEEVFLEQVVSAWRTGGTQVKDLALAALRVEDPNVILSQLLADGAEAIDALIHAIRRGQWQPHQVNTEVHGKLLSVVQRGCDEGGPLDQEGRLAATLARWPSPGIAELLSDYAGSADGKRLLRATFAALPPKRGETLAIELLESALEDQADGTAQWLGGELLGFALVDQFEMQRRLETSHPDIADFYRDQFDGVESKPSPLTYDESTDDPPQTAEIDLSDVVSEPIPLGSLPARSGASLLGLGLAMARALTTHHKEGVVVHPTAFSVTVMPDETMVAEPGEDSPSCPRPLMEPPSTSTDVYAAAVLLLEVLLGKPWPRNIPAARAIPYLRWAVALLPPAAIAPLDAALHPDPAARPADGLAWLAMWQTAAVAEEARQFTARNPAARLRVGYDSHIGRMKLLLTQTNQDALFLSTKGPLSLLVVCDGISTANAGSGDVASSIAVHVIANLWEQALPRLAQASSLEIREFLDRALRMANTAVCEAALRFAGGNLDGRVPMGTTAVVALAYGNHVSLAWLGDSRAYLVSNYGASLITADENQAGERLRAWQLNFVENWDPAGFALVGYLGHFNELSRPEALTAHHTSFTMVPGEALVMCSDGVTDYIGETHPEVAGVLADTVTLEDLDETARKLTCLANRGGGGDNASCLIATLW